MRAGPDRWTVQKRSKRYVNIGALSYDREDQRSTDAAVRIVSVRFSVDEELVGARRDSQLFSLDSREGLESCASRSTTFGAVTIQCILKLVGYFVLHSSTATSAFEHSLFPLISRFVVWTFRQLPAMALGVYIGDQCISNACLMFGWATDPGVQKGSDTRRCRTRLRASRQSSRSVSLMPRVPSVEYLSLWREP